LPKFTRSDYKKTFHISEIRSNEDARSVADQLVMPLIEAMSQGVEDPFREY